MHIVILGNGIAGISTARHLRKLDPACRISIISAETDHFFSRTALMYIYMGHLRYAHTKPYEDSFWPENRIELLRTQVEAIVPARRELQLTGGETLAYDKLVLATGSRSNFFGWPGQELEGVQGLYSYQDLENLEATTPGIRRGVIVGGGLIGIELAEMLHSRGKAVTFLVRENSFWSNVLPAAESAMVNREILRNGIALRLGAGLAEILPDDAGRVRAVRTTAAEEIPCEFVGITAGVSPRIELAAETGIETGRGFLVDEYLQTNVPDIYAIGDCAELRQPAPGRRGIEAVWYTGKLMGPVLARTLTGEPTPYRQGVWFNSAKFFDLEYQVYGEVPNAPRENEQHLYWEHSNGKHAIRIVYQAQNGRVLGFNLMGVRYRAQACMDWIAQGAHIESVLHMLPRANFDPEFYPAFEAAVLRQYQQSTGNFSLSQKGVRGL